MWRWHQLQGAVWVKTDQNYGNILPLSSAQHSLVCGNHNRPAGPAWDVSNNKDSTNAKQPGTDTIGWKQWSDELTVGFSLLILMIEVHLSPSCLLWPGRVTNEWELPTAMSCPCLMSQVSEAVTAQAPAPGQQVPRSGRRCALRWWQGASLIFFTSFCDHLQVRRPVTRTGTRTRWQVTDRKLIITRHKEVFYFTVQQPAEILFFIVRWWHMVTQPAEILFFIVRGWHNYVNRVLKNYSYMFDAKNVSGRTLEAWGVRCSDPWRCEQGGRWRVVDLRLLEQLWKYSHRLLSRVTKWEIYCSNKLNMKTSSFIYKSWIISMLSTLDDLRDTDAIFWSSYWQ